MELGRGYLRDTEDILINRLDFTMRIFLCINCLKDYNKNVKIFLCTT